MLELPQMYLLILHSLLRPLVLIAVGCTRLDVPHLKEPGNCCFGGSACESSGPKQLQHGKFWRRGNATLDDRWGLSSGEHVQHQMALRRGRRMGNEGLFPTDLHLSVGEHGVHGELSA